MKTGASLSWLSLLCLLGALPACEREPRPLQLSDLTPDETRYIEQLVILERAKAVLLVDPPLGQTLLDSLSTAWGDSARADVRALIPRDPVRSEAVHELFGRILDAEEDSLLDAARPDRLGAPLPDPPPATKPEDTGYEET